MKINPDKILTAAADLSDGDPKFLAIALTPQLRKLIAAVAAQSNLGLMPPPKFGARRVATPPEKVLTFAFDYRDGNPKWLRLPAVPEALRVAVSKATGFTGGGGGVGGGSGNGDGGGAGGGDDDSDPNAIRIKPGENWRASIASGKTVLLPRGEVFTQPFNPPGVMTDVQIGTYGSKELAAPRIRVDTGRCFGVSRWKRLTVDGIDFDGGGTAAAVRLFGCADVTFHKCSVTGGSFGVVVEGDEQATRNTNVRFIACRIFDNDRPDQQDSSGLFVSGTDGLTIDGCLLDRNGWTPNVSAPTFRNHNVYIHGSCGPAQVTNSIFARASSHGLQARSGGVVRGNLFLDNPIHLSYGLVNGGGPVFAGGVVGEVAENLFLGAGDIGPGNLERGFCLQLGNIRDVVVRDNWMGSDNGQGLRFAAIQVERCKLNPDHHGGPDVGIMALKFTGNRVTWRGGELRVSGGMNVTPQQPAWMPANRDVRAAMAADMLATARDGTATPPDIIRSIRALAP